MWRSFFTISMEEDEEGGVGLVTESSRARRALQCRMLPARSCAIFNSVLPLALCLASDYSLGLASAGTYAAAAGASVCVDCGAGKLPHPPGLEEEEEEEVLFQNLEGQEEF